MFRLFPLLLIASSALFSQDTARQPYATESDSHGTQTVFTEPAKYPAYARLKRIEGTVSLHANVDARGQVIDATVTSGPDELRRAALEALLKWQFTGTGSTSTAQVDMRFKLGAPSEAQKVIVKVDYADMPEGMRQKIEAALALKAGDSVDVKDVIDTLAELKILANAMVREQTLMFLGAPMRIRVGGNVQAAKLVKQPAPVYPPLAKQARIQGTVRYEATVGADGNVKNLQLTGGHPLLVPAATDAVKQWVYQTTLLNGKPVEVLTQIDVNFTLSEGAAQ